MRTFRSSLAATAALAVFSALPIHAQPAPPPTKQPLAPEKEPIINPEALKVVYGMLGTYQAMGSYSDQTHISVEGTQGIPQWVRENFPLDGTLQWQRPSSLRFEGTIANKKSLALSDGKTLRAINPTHPGLWIERNQIPIERSATGEIITDLPPAGPPPRLDAAMYDSGANLFSLMFMTGPDEWARTMKNVKVIALEPDTDVDGVSCRVVNTQAQSDDGHLSTVRFWIGRDDKLLRRLEFGSPGMGNFKLVEEHSHVQVNPALPASTWEFQAPANAKPVEYFPNPNPHEFDPAIKVGDLLPAFTGEDLNGQPFILNPQSGKTTVIEFFLMQSGMYDLQTLEKLKKTLAPSKVQLFAVSGDSMGSRLKAYAEKYKLTLPIYYDDNAMFNQVAQKFGIKGWAATFIFGPDGKLKTITHMPGELEFMTAIKELFPGTSDDAFFLNDDERIAQ